MPKRLPEYSLREWRQLRPLTHSYKTWRYRRINRAYMKRAARVGDPAALARAVAGRHVLTTVAFDDPLAIRWQATLIRHYVPRALYVIVDNSSDDAAAREIATIATRSGAPYLRLPENPWWGAGRFSRSHGIALNWVWTNVLRPGMPRAFGFIDDDLFPTAPDDPFAPLNTQNFFGMVRQVGPRWFLWAGYCMFRYDTVKDKPLDFGQDWFIGLDTGGANWDVLYRHCNRQALKEAPTLFKPYRDGVDIHEGMIQWCGTWLHEIGSTGHVALAADKRRVVAEILSPHLLAASESAITGLAEGARPF